MEPVELSIILKNLVVKLSITLKMLEINYKMVVIKFMIKPEEPLSMSKMVVKRFLVVLKMLHLMFNLKLQMVLNMLKIKQIMHMNSQRIQLYQQKITPLTMLKMLNLKPNHLVLDDLFLYLDCIDLKYYKIDLN